MFGFNVNFGGIGEEFEIFNCVIDIEVNVNKQRQTMQAPRIIIEQQFLRMCQEIAQINAPAKIKLSRIAQCSNDWFDEVVERELFIIFENNMYCDENNK